MRKSIVIKLFLMTASLCTVVIAGLFIVQSVFFKQIYVQQKVGSVQKTLSAASHEDGNAKDAMTAFRNEQLFYQKYNTWTARLDSLGNLKYTDDFEVVARLDNTADTLALSGKPIHIPLYTVMEVEQLSEANPLQPDFFIKHCH
ncbi:hypothetical protein A8990_15211 [Paenibacillus taihuensis]|uniref:Uncharacterized protein n=1 Tax=Paenibacillus taihuensis TaxID=1156355 RepID=A0A3D9Q977_9BACL|nr:hypothetical protein [Paenibacillus taihuensis]REE57566.1 hypothetical protein A8990_15211 [Paenibacillus taihuensis]